jgi:putative copper export protein
MVQAVAAIALIVASRMTASAGWKLSAAAVIGLALSAPLLGHPAAVTDLPALALAFDATHTLTAGIWTGGILVLALVAAPALVHVASADRIPVARHLLHLFTPLALVSALVIVISGVGSAWLQLRDLEALWASAYGQALLRKLVLVVVVAGLGAYHWRVARHSLGSERSLGRLRLSLGIDVMAVLAVLVLTAVLTGTSPP